jgi:Mg2+/citrate symporter
MLSYGITIIASMTLICLTLGIAVMERFRREQTRYNNLKRFSLVGDQELANYLRGKLTSNIQPDETMNDEEIIAMAHFRLWTAGRRAHKYLKPSDDVHKKLLKETLVIFLILCIPVIIAGVIMGILDRDLDFIIGFMILLIDAVLFTRIYWIHRELEKLDKSSLEILAEHARDS